MALILKPAHRDEVQALLERHSEVCAAIEITKDTAGWTIMPDDDKYTDICRIDLDIARTALEAQKRQIELSLAAFEVEVTS